MKLGDYKLVLVVAGLIGVLLIATSAIAGAIRLPGEEQFSELYLLGPNHMAENYPSNIAIGQNYSVYVNVGNHLGSSAHYVLYVKLGNETDQLPNNSLGLQSPLQPLYEYRFSIQDGRTWENLLNFSVSSASISGNNSQIHTFQTNGISNNINKPALWNSNSTSFRYQLLFELWIYNNKTNSISYNDRFVYLQLDLTNNNVSP